MLLNDLPSNQTSNPGTGGYAPVNGINLYYEVHGHGAPLILIHGGGSTLMTTFGNILPALAASFKVIGVEMQAHGHTADRNHASSFEQDADDVAALLGFLKTPRASLFGFSNGGSAALQVAIRHPRVVSKLVIASSIYQREGMLPGFFEGMEHASLENMPTPLKTAYLQINNDQKGLQAMHDRDKNRMLSFHNWSDADLQAIEAPTLVLNADRDVVVCEHAVKMSRLIRHASLAILPGTHGSYIGEICSVEPGSRIAALTVALIEEFLRK